MSTHTLKTILEAPETSIRQNSSERYFIALVAASLVLHIAGFIVLAFYEQRLAGDPPKIIMVDMATLPEPEPVKAAPPPQPVKPQSPVKSVASPSIASHRPVATQSAPVPIAPLGDPVESRQPTQKAEMAVPVAPSAPRRVAEHPPATSVSTPSPPQSTSADTAEKLAKARSSYRALIAGLIEKNKEYPLFSRKAGHQGTCHVRCTMTCGGEILRVDMLRSSGYDSLDKAALRAVQNVGKFPPPPTDGRCTEVSFDVPITFRLS